MMKVELQTHDKGEFVEVIEGFNLKDFVDEVNTETHKMIIFGDIGLSKNLIKMVRVVKEEA